MIREFLIVFVTPSVIGIVVTDPPPPAIDYKYSYNVQDPSTGDTKNQYEVSQGNVVSGQYSVVEPDGSQRIVDYSAHPQKGFFAVVHTSHNTEPTYTTPRNYVIKLKNMADLNQHYAARPKTVYTYAEEPRRRITYIPVPYNIKTYHEPESSGPYFTPANEIESSDFPKKQGQYFVPAYEK